MDNNDKNLTRRSLLKGTAAVAGGVVLSSTFAINSALASDTTCFFGLGVPETGPYAKQGKDLLNGFELAITHINEGHALAKAISTKTTKGLLGKTIEFGVIDTASNPTKAVEGFSGLISDKKATLLAGSVSSAVAIASQKLAQREKVIYLAGISGSNATTGSACQRYGFRACHYAYTSSKALAPILAKELGKTRKVAYLVPDYTYGHSVLESMKEFTEEQGWETVSEQFSPLGTKDFSAYLLNIASSGADVLVNICFGADAVKSINQAKEFGLFDTMAQVVPYMAPFLAHELGAEMIEGVYGATDFWWTLSEENDLAKQFVETFSAKYGYKPEWGAHTAYTQIMLYADAVERAGTLDAAAVVKVYEDGHKINTAIGEVHWRAEDHQLVRPVYIVKGKKKADMANEEDYYSIVGTASGESVMPPIEKFGCKMGDL